jgi:hypothetical protein
MCIWSESKWRSLEQRLGHQTIHLSLDPHLPRARNTNDPPSNGAGVSAHLETQAQQIADAVQEKVVLEEKIDELQMDTWEQSGTIEHLETDAAAELKNK